jgi:GT2 family glycosyltransferase
MDLSIIIINYKSAAHVLNCLESVYAQTHQHSFEVIVVDNNSGDNSEGLIMEQYPGVRWLQTGYNAGFARANNAGMRLAAGKYFLLLNADTIVLARALDTTIDLFEQTDGMACGVQLLNPDGSHQISGAHFKRGGTNFLLPLPYLGGLVRWAGYRLKTRVPSVKEVPPVLAVDWIVGAFILVRREAVEAAGMLDEDFFMYAEEIEWCSRLRKKGPLYLFAAPQVIHLGGGTSGSYYATDDNDNSKNLWSKKAFQIMVSKFVGIRKQFGLLWFLIMYAVFIIEIPVFFFGLLVEKTVKRARSRYHWNQFAGYVANVSGLLSYFPKIILNKPFFYKVY